MDNLQTYKRELREFTDEIYRGENKVLVYGEGPLNPELMLIGEAPGEQEALAGRPFIGKAGKNLDEMLERCGLTRAQIYIANAVKFRPVKQSNLGACGHFINTVKRVIINEIMIKHIEKARTQNLFL